MSTTTNISASIVVITTCVAGNYQLAYFVTGIIQDRENSIHYPASTFQCQQMHLQCITLYGQLLKTKSICISIFTRQINFNFLIYYINNTVT